MDNGNIGISRKLFIALANDQLARRRRIFGSQANVCRGCTEILMCHGPVSFQVCQALDELMECGHITGPKKIKYEHLRRKVLPISIECLIAYGLAKEPAKFIDRVEKPLSPTLGIDDPQTHI